MKKWLLREEPEDKHDIRLWQTFRNIDLQTAIKLHEEKPGAKAPATPQIHPADANTTMINHSPEMSRNSSIASVMFVDISSFSSLFYFLPTSLIIVYRKKIFSFHQTMMN